MSAYNHYMDASEFYKFCKSRLRVNQFIESASSTRLWEVYQEWAANRLGELGPTYKIMKEKSFLKRITRQFHQDVHYSRGAFTVWGIQVFDTEHECRVYDSNAKNFELIIKEVIDDIKYLNLYIKDDEDRHDTVDRLQEVIKRIPRLYSKK